MATVQTEFTTYFREQYDRIEALPQMVRNEIRRLMDVAEQGFLRGNDNYRLSDYVNDTMLDFEFNRLERGLAKQLEEMIAEELHQMRRLIEEGRVVNYRNRASVMIDKLRSFKNRDFYLDENFRTLTRQIEYRYQVNYDDISYYFRRKASQIEVKINEMNEEILDDMIRKVPDLFEDLENFMKKKEQERTIKMSFPFMTNGVLGGGEVHDIKPFSFKKLEGTDCYFLEYYDRTVGNDKICYTILEGMRDEGRFSFINVPLYSYDSFWNATNNGSLRLRVADMQVLYEKSPIDYGKPVMNIETLLYGPRKITVYLDDDLKCILLEDAQKLGMPIDQVGEYHRLTPEQFQQLAGQFDISYESVTLQQDKVREQVQDQAQSSSLRDLFVDGDSKTITVYLDNFTKCITVEDAQKLGLPVAEGSRYLKLNEKQFQNLKSENKVVYDRETMQREREQGQAKSTLLSDYLTEIEVAAKAEKPEEKQEPQYDPTTRPTVMIYIGAEGNLYTNVPMNIDKVAINELGSAIKPDELIGFMESANIVWVKFDVMGTLGEPSKEEIDAMLDNILGNVCTPKEVYSANGVYGYTIDYVLKDGSLSSSIIV